MRSARRTGRCWRSAQEGLTQSQIAARLEVPLGTVKTRAFHALRALRAALARQGFDLTA